MFSGFQSNSFQTGFQISRSGVAPPVVTETRGGIDERDYHRYRKHLEKLIEVTNEADKAKYVAIKKDIQVLNELDLETPEINKILERPILTGTLKLIPDIDFSLLKEEIALIEAYLSERFLLIEYLREKDDEAAFLLLLQ